MRDEIDSRIWTEHHQNFSEDVASLLAAIGASVGTALRRLNEIEFEAPWKRDARGPGRA
jgi:hypothetical protein